MWLDLTESVKAMRRMTQVLAWKSNPAFWLMTTTSVLPWVSGYWHAQQIWNYYEAIPWSEWMNESLTAGSLENFTTSAKTLLSSKVTWYSQIPQVGVAFSAAQTWRIPESWFSKPVACISQWRLLGVWRRCSPPLTPPGPAESEPLF